MGKSVYKVSTLIHTKQILYFKIFTSAFLVRQKNRKCFYINVCEIGVCNQKFRSMHAHDSFSVTRNVRPWLYYKDLPSRRYVINDSIDIYLVYFFPVEKISSEFLFLFY